MNEDLNNLHVLGTHCYLGGFLIGLQEAGFNIIGSLESWKQGMDGAKSLGLFSQPLSDSLDSKLKGVKADIVVGNPPCSRFSHLSLSFFKKQHHEDISTFPEILELVQVAKKVKASTIWWETGPLAWSLGQPLVHNFHQYLKEVFGEIITLVIRIDLRSIGIPQRRPRTHIIHRITKSIPPGSPCFPRPSTINVNEWINTKTKGFELKNPAFQEESRNPLEWANNKRSTMTFRSMVPKIINKTDLWTPSVVSRRLFIWKEENRWFDLLEYASLMSYPLEKISKLATASKSSLNAQVLISKSVSPAITKWVGQKIIVPWIKNKKRNDKIKPVYWNEGMWKLDLQVSSKLEKALKNNQKMLF